MSWTNSRALAVIALAALATLSSCGGGGSSGPVPSSSGEPGSSPTAAVTPTPSPPPVSSQTIETNAGTVAGTTGMFSPTEGDTPSGGSGAPVDGIDCEPTMSNNYHIHIFLGVFYNGAQMALPIGVGMENPGTPVSGFLNTATCFYFLHTHDSSGIVHVEDPNPTNAPITASLFTLQNVLDVWGITADANHFGPFNGPVEVFTSGQVYRGDQNNGTVPASTLTYWGSNPNTIPLYSHELIYVFVGTPPASVPSVNFYTEY